MEFLKRAIDLIRRKPKTVDGFTVLNIPGEGTLMADQLTMDYLTSEKPQPTQASLNAALSRMVRVRVYEGGMIDGNPTGNNILLETSDSASFLGLREALQIVDEPGGHCMCLGDPTFELIANDGTQTAVIGLHHGVAIRWNEWKYDAILENGRKLLDWLAEHGVSKPLEDYLEMQREAEESKEAAGLWLSATPECVKTLCEKSMGLPMISESDLSEIEAVLHRSYPDFKERALILFSWFGMGKGPWSGYPSYESIPEDLLHGIPLRHLISALETDTLDEAHLEGAARYFAVSVSGPKHKRKPSMLPAALRQLLLHHSLKESRSEWWADDKRKRAKHAFA